MQGRHISAAERITIKVEHAVRLDLALASNEFELSRADIPCQSAIIGLAAGPQERVGIKRNIVGIRAVHDIDIVGNNDWERCSRCRQRVEPREKRPRQASGIDRAATRTIHFLVEPFAGQDDPDRIGRRVQYFRAGIADVAVIIVFARHEIVDVTVARAHLDRTAHGQNVIDHRHIQYALVRLRAEVSERCFERARDAVKIRISRCDENCTTGRVPAKQRALRTLQDLHTFDIEKINIETIGTRPVMTVDIGAHRWVKRRKDIVLDLAASSAPVKAVTATGTS